MSDAPNSLSTDRERLRQVLGAFYKTVDVMKSARNSEKHLMNIWADDMKAVEDVMFFLEQLRDSGDAAQAGPASVRKALEVAYRELKAHDADYHYRTPISVNNLIVDALAPQPLDSAYTAKEPRAVELAVWELVRELRYQGLIVSRESFAALEKLKAALSVPSTPQKTPCAHAAIIGLNGMWHCQKCGDAIEMAVAHSSTQGKSP